MLTPRNGNSLAAMSSPIRDPQNPIPPPFPPLPEDGRPDGSAHPPPLPHVDHPIPPPLPHAAPVRPVPPPPPPTASAVDFAIRMNRNEVATAAKVARTQAAGERGFAGPPWSDMLRRKVVWPELGLRASALLLCMIAFSMMASDKTEGWAGDSYDRYEEFRYLVGVNVIAFLHSAFHVYEWIHHMITRKYIITRSFRYYFDLTMDQILAYLLMSASSAAAARNDAWVSTFGSDSFTDKASKSIAFSFLAFIPFALCSLYSAHSFFSGKL